ncbi:MAG: hypothetical protein HY326_03300 [Chloroflexi bacterium]|nr:hypothetical protein [Chloroflexota bacterium]
MKQLRGFVVFAVVLLIGSALTAVAAAPRWGDSPIQADLIPAGDGGIVPTRHLISAPQQATQSPTATLTPTSTATGTPTATASATATEPPSIDVRIYDTTHLRQIDFLIYVIKNNEVYAGKSTYDPTRVVLSMENNVIFNSRIHTNDHRLYKIIGNRILPPESSNFADAVYSFEGDRFYRGSQTNDESRRIFTRRADKIYRGSSNNLADVVLSFEGDFDQLQPFLAIIADLRP